MKPYFLFLLVYLFIVNLWAFLQMGIDKARSRKQQWRISEKMLFLPVLLGGGPGGILGMKHFHHKTRHWYFQYGFPAITLLQCLLILKILFQ